jgi:hypothetical protein
MLIRLYCVCLYSTIEVSLMFWDHGTAQRTLLTSTSNPIPHLNYKTNILNPYFPIILFNMLTENFMNFKYPFFLCMLRSDEHTHAHMIPDLFCWFKSFCLSFLFLINTTSIPRLKAYFFLKSQTK